MALAYSNVPIKAAFQNRRLWHPTAPTTSTSSTFLQAKGDGKKVKKPLKTVSARFIDDNGIQLTTDEEGRVTAQYKAILEKETQDDKPKKIDEDNSQTTTTPISRSTDTIIDNEVKIPEVLEKGEEAAKSSKKKQIFFKKPPKPKESLKEQPATVVPRSGFNVVLTHCTADFDSLASAVGLAKLWASSPEESNPVVSNNDSPMEKDFDSASHVPTFVVLPRGNDSSLFTSISFPFDP
jgi:hypothetical protein